MEQPVKYQQKQFIMSLIINGAMAIYALCSFIAALQKGAAWRILLTGTGVIFFIAASAVTIMKMVKLRKGQHLQP